MCVRVSISLEREGHCFLDARDLRKQDIEEREVNINIFIVLVGLVSSNRDVSLV